MGFVLKNFFLEATNAAALIFQDKLEVCGHFCTKKNTCGGEVKNHRIMQIDQKLFSLSEDLPCVWEGEK